MRFLADMGISHLVTQALCEDNHNALHLRDEGLQRLPDVEILKKACNENRILLTHDLDFGYLLAISGECTPSVILFRTSSMRPDDVIKCLRHAIKHHAQDLQNGAFITITDSGTRARRLPIGSGDDEL